MEELDMKAGREFLLKKFKEKGDFDFFTEKEIESMLDILIAEDKKYTDEIEAQDDEAFYDEDAAYERMLNVLKSKVPDKEMYCMRFTDDYMDYWEEYLESIGAIEWV